ncbi:hypothetical protein [Kibdelosporangium aridum]|nr:hypothetical protein [Kibdelosporangium aridum]
MTEPPVVVDVVSGHEVAVRDETGAWVILPVGAVLGRIVVAGEGK